MQLGLSDEEFGRLNPRLLHLLLDRRTEEIEHREHLNGIVAAAIANNGMYRPDPPRTPAHFMPSRWGLKQKISRNRLQTSAKWKLEQSRAFLMARVTRTEKPHGNHS